MRHRCLPALAALLLALPSAAPACPPEAGGKDERKPLDLSVHGRSPGYENGSLVVEAGIDHGVSVLFEPTDDGAYRLRPARADEHSTATRPVYRFAWQQDGSARLHELADPALIARLNGANERDTATPAGEAYESHVLAAALQEGKVLQDCVGRNPGAPASIDVFVEVDAAGKASVPALLPEGDIAECIAGRIEGVQVDVPPTAPFTAEALIRITP